MWSAMSPDSAKLTGAVSTLGPTGTDSEHEARKHFSEVLLFSSFAAAVEHARETQGYVLIPTGYLDCRDGQVSDTWVDMHFRMMGRMRMVAVWESPTKTMCLAVNRRRVAVGQTIRTVALHPATAVLARQTCAEAEATYVNSKPLAVEAAANGLVDACIGSVDVVAETRLDPLHYFHPTMVWCLYAAAGDPGDAEALPALQPNAC